MAQCSDEQWSLFPKALEDIWGVRRGVDPLHGGDDAHLAEPRDVVGMEVLGVLDAPAEARLPRIGCKGALVDVQHFPVRPVADGVGVELKSVLDGETMSARDRTYIATVKNLRTGAVATEIVDADGYFAAAWADLSRKAVAEAGDRVEVAVIDGSGDIVSGPLVSEITPDEIRNAVVNVRLRLGDIIPAKPALL
ncbi:hypothetical protein LCGC14_2856170, partial [marine sediment metagenome]